MMKSYLKLQNKNTVEYDAVLTYVGEHTALKYQIKLTKCWDVER